MREMSGEERYPELTKALRSQVGEADRRLGEVQGEIDSLYDRLYLMEGGGRFSCAAFALSSAFAVADCEPEFCKERGCGALGPRIACRGGLPWAAHALCDGCWQNSPLAGRLCDFVVSRERETECPFCSGETKGVLERDAVKAGMPWQVLRKLA